jgi:hypothetical protein
MEGAFFGKENIVHSYTRQKKKKKKKELDNIATD